jgi:phosphoribosylformimino-5-aminoimidazole carboxamide ribotide isomerase
MPAPKPTSGSLTLFPAIDVRGGHAVRLVQGDYDRETRFDDDPAAAARRWADGGAAILHVVDLDGARAGEPVNLEAITRIADAVDVPIQVGGGLRDRRSVEQAFAAGAQRVVLGTSAQRDPDLLGELTDLYPGRIVASVDARGDRVAVEGWEQATGTRVEQAIEVLAGRGVSTFLYTPVEVDGTLEGPGIAGLAPILRACDEAGAELLYSGGVGSIADLEALAGLRAPSMTGVIVGRALYDGRFTVQEAIDALRGSGGRA